MAAFFKNTNIVPMAFKKIDQDFVLSDSTVNVYGFRLRTDGCVMEEVLKNPIGYLNHEHEGGILLKWEDVRLSGDQILGKPVINMEHPRAERTVKEIEDGFLNAASVGNICLLDHEFEENPLDADKPILVGLKWYYKECSLVDSPGNRNAFKAELYDANDQLINLSDLITVNQLKNQVTNMKKIELPINAALISLLSLGDEPTADAVVKGIKDLSDRVKTAEQALQDLKDETVNKEVNDLLDAAAGGKAPKITAKQKELFAKQYAKKPKDLKDVLESMGAFVSVNDKIAQTANNHGGATEYTPEVKALMDKGWDKLDREGGLAELKDLSDEGYNELYKGKFKCLPNESVAGRKK